MGTGGDAGGLGRPFWPDGCGDWRGDGNEWPGDGSEWLGDGSECFRDGDCLGGEDLASNRDEPTCGGDDGSCDEEDVSCGEGATGCRGPGAEGGERLLLLLPVSLTPGGASALTAGTAAAALLSTWPATNAAVRQTRPLALVSHAVSALPQGQDYNLLKLL